MKKFTILATTLLFSGLAFAGSEADMSSGTVINQTNTTSGKNIAQNDSIGGSGKATGWGSKIIGAEVKVNGAVAAATIKH